MESECVHEVSSGLVYRVAMQAKSSPEATRYKRLLGGHTKLYGQSQQINRLAWRKTRPGLCCKGLERFGCISERKHSYLNRDGDNAVCGKRTLKKKDGEVERREQPVWQK
ncbi:hypothetical protein ElyMa_002245000 [Elysia marginata]|uniref:Uncharacterized protein n=1 Tax=Elysia marginata TaxID=1093978 RepID=A0AAV4FYI1_9GAST|nr:hypothetical protein ElyMa_002245000 [Elysia marginata]